MHSKTKPGALAHLARASDWQSEGDRFESDMLHKLTVVNYFGNIQQWVFPLLFCSNPITYVHYEKNLFNHVISENCRENVGNKHLLYTDTQYRTEVRYSPQFNNNLQGDIPRGMPPVLFYGIPITYKHVHKVISQIFIVQHR